MKNAMRCFFAVVLVAACVATGVLSSFLMRPTAVSDEVQALIARASTSDRAEGYLTCTGTVDSNNEAVFVLDTTTGQLAAGVVSKMPNTPGFQARYQTNVHLDLEKAVAAGGGTVGKATIGKKKSRTRKTDKKKDEADIPGKLEMPQEPKYIMCTGGNGITGVNSTVRPATSSLFITEVNTGIMLVYVLPWDLSAHASNKAVTTALPCYFTERFVIPQVIEEALDE